MRIALLFAVYCSLVHGNCDFHGDKHTEPIQSKMKSWKIFEKELPISSDALTYAVGICKSPGDSPKDAAIVQKRGNVSIVLGKLTQVNLVSGDGWILLTYENGDPYNNACNNVSRTASIMFVCGANTSGLSIRQEHTDADNHCNYMFQLQVPEMCPEVKKDNKMSGGAIFLIVLAAAYLVLGGIYMHVKRGARGLDRIPNLDMWRKLGGLAADGCDFCCRCDRPSHRAGYLFDESGPDFRGDDDILSP